MSARQVVGLTVIGLAAAFGLGRMTASSTPPPSTRVAPARVAPPVVVVQAAPRAERPPPAAPRPMAVEQVDPEEGQRDAAALDLVDRAIASGRWTDQDKQALFAQLGTLSEPALLEAMSALAAAVNRGEVKIEGGVVF